MKKRLCVDEIDADTDMVRDFFCMLIYSAIQPCNN